MVWWDKVLVLIGDTVSLEEIFEPSVLVCNGIFLLYFIGECFFTAHDFFFQSLDIYFFPLAMGAWQKLQLSKVQIRLYSLKRKVPTAGPVYLVPVFL